MNPVKRSLSQKLILFVAEGFGTGRFPVAPGTVGTLAGFLWAWILLLPQNVLIYMGGIILGFFLAVWFGARGEKILGRNDPGSIVIDEIAALPLALFGAVLAQSRGVWAPAFDFYCTRSHWIDLAVAFAAFRVFDVTKPWIIGRSQALPRGWGLVVDDFLAAVPVIPFTYLASKLL